MLRSLCSVFAAALILLGGPGSRVRAEDAPTPPDPTRPALAFHVEEDGFVLRQYELACLSQLGYLIGHAGEALLVDPPRDPEAYLEDAEVLGLRVVGVLLTHLHADFVAGHAEVRRRCEVPIFAPAASALDVEHEPLADGRHLTVGGLDLEVVATPGHTVDGITVLVRRPGEAEAAFVLSGDLVLPGTLGAPETDEGEGAAARLAAAAFDSLQRIALLPDEARLLPAHGGGYFGGRKLEPWTVTRVGREKTVNPFWKAGSRSRFVARALALRVPPPPSAVRIRTWNRRGAPAAPKAQVPALVAPPAIAQLLDEGAWVVDARDAAAYAAAHLRGAVNVPPQGPFAAWFGAVVPERAAVLLVGEDAVARDAVRRLARVGIDAVAGRVAVDPGAWRAAGLDVAASAFVAAPDLARRRAAWVDPLLVDVRSPREVAARGIEDSLNVPLGSLDQLAELVEPDRPLLFACLTAFRSTIAVGLAERMGFESVGVLAGGLKAWQAASLPTVPPTLRTR